MTTTDTGRLAYLHDYPGDADAKVAAVCRDWGVTEVHTVEVGPQDDDPWGTYMLRFQDGLWRKAVFGGGSTHMVRCGRHGVPGETGAEAEARLAIADCEATLGHHADQLVLHRDRLRELNAALEQIMTSA